jgi:hypothetical protein
MDDLELAAASLLRAFLLGDRDTGVLILRQHSGAQEKLTLAVTALANRVLLSACGSDVARALTVVDQWIDGYAKTATALEDLGR